MVFKMKILVLPNDPLSQYKIHGNYHQFMDRIYYYKNFFDVKILNFDNTKIFDEKIKILNYTLKRNKILEITNKIRKLKKIDCDIIRVFDGVSFVESFSASVAKENRYIFASFHGIWSDWIKSRKSYEKIFIKIFKKYSENHVDVAFCVSNQIFKILDFKNKYIIPNYIDKNVFKPINIEKKYDLIFVGSLREDKGIFDLLTLFKKIKKEKKDVKLLLIGKKYVNLPNIDGIYYLGVKDYCLLPKFYNMSKIFVSLSHSEGFGMPLIEAQACELPVVARDLEVFKEITFNSFLSNNYNYLKDTIIYLLEDEKSRKKIGVSARKFVINNFEKEKILNKEVDIIRRFLGGLYPL